MRENSTLVRYAVEILVAEGPDAIDATKLSEKAGVQTVAIADRTLRDVTRQACQQVTAELWHNETARQLAFEWLDKNRARTRPVNRAKVQSQTI